MTGEAPYWRRSCGNYRGATIVFHYSIRTTGVSPIFSTCDIAGVPVAAGVGVGVGSVGNGVGGFENDLHKAMAPLLEPLFLGSTLMGTK